MTNAITNTTDIKKGKKDNVLQTIVNIGTVVVFFILVILIYKYLIKTDHNNLVKEGFDNKIDKPDKKDKFEDTDTSAIDNRNNTVYETALIKIYGDNKRLICSMIPSIDNDSNVCNINNTPYIIHKYPVHIIKLNDDSILAVFNDGRMYQKNTMDSTIWKGPIQNSMPQGTIPLRMVTLSTDLKTLLGIGYDNTLYVKAPISVSNESDDKTVDSGVRNSCDAIEINLDFIEFTSRSRFSELSSSSLVCSSF